MFLLACPRGYFGNKCTEECNETCAECNNVNGMCESGCIPGWRGYLCNEGSVHNIQFWSGKFQAGYRYINFQNNFNIKKKNYATHKLNATTLLHGYSECGIFTSNSVYFI